MADNDAVTKPIVTPTPSVKVVEAPKLEVMRGDLSYLDKIPKIPGKHDNAKKSLCWYGALPAVGTVTNYKFERGVKVAYTTTAIEAWTKADSFSVWYGKCPWFQSIGIRGIVFPAFTNYATRSGFEPPSAPVAIDNARAGAVDYFTDEQIAQIVYECDHTMVKAPGENEPPHKADIYRLIEDPPGSGKYVHESQGSGNDAFRKCFYNAETDRPVSDYVYFMKIQYDYQQQDIVSIMRNPLTSLSGR